MYIIFVEDIPLCLLNLKITKYFLVSVKQNNIFYFYLDDMFRWDGWLSQYSD